MSSLFRKIDECLQAEKAFVVYQEPDEQEVRFLKGGLQLLDATMSPPGPGFFFAPFSADSKAYFLVPEETDFVHYHGKEDVGRPVQLPLKEAGDIRDKHLRLVERALEDLESSRLSKVVLSRVIEVAYRHSPSAIFHNLLRLYPEAFCYLWYAPETGLWAGATPELLGTVQDKEFRTVSLAGTQAFQGSYRVAWGEKEQEEQHFVTTYIHNILDQYLTGLEVSDAETIRAGELLHLRTRIRGIIRPEEFFNLIRKLHPTPAVCGIPLEDATRFIEREEGYDREFYTGFLGPHRVFDSDHSSAYVNLRCMKLSKKKARIYVGGGITLDSDPEQEWKETVAKSQTMKRVLSLQPL